MAQDPSGRFTGADLVEVWKSFDTPRAADRAYKAESWTEEQCRKWLRLPEDELRAKYQSPMKAMRKEGLEAALSVCWAQFVDAREEGCPQQRLKYFEQFQDECIELLDQITAREAELASTSTRNIFSTNLTPGAPSGGTPGAGPAPAG